MIPNGQAMLARKKMRAPDPGKTKLYEAHAPRFALGAPVDGFLKRLDLRAAVVSTAFDAWDFS